MGKPYSKYLPEVATYSINILYNGINIRKEEPRYFFILTLKYIKPTSYVTSSET